MPTNLSGGMLGNLFTRGFDAARAEDKDELLALERQSAMDGFQADRFATYQGAQMAGKGAASALAAGMGKDPRSAAEKNAAAIQAAKDQVAKLGFNPDDPKSMDEFYKKVIAILQGQGLIAEAMAVGQEYRTAKQAYAKEQLGIDNLQLERDKLQRQRDRDLQIDERARERNEILKKRFGQAASPMGKLLADMERATDPAQREYLKKSVENLAAGKIIVQDLGDRVQLIDATTRQVLRADDKGLPPATEMRDENARKAAENAYQTFMLGMQKQYDAVVDLYNHPGVEGITGRYGRNVGEEGFVGGFTSVFSSDEAGAALALYKQVTGGTFLAGLAQLKAASKTGASGLGAVSEKEGDKVQSDAAALDRLQQPEAFRAQLEKYAHYLESLADEYAAAAPKDNIAPRRLQKRALTGPVGRGARRGKPRVAPAAVTSNSQNGGNDVRTMPDRGAPAQPQPIGTWTPEKESRLQELRKKLGK